jgi:iron complex transport system ATP-binding protein
MSEALRIEGALLRLDGRAVLDGASLVARSGEVTGVIGPNGAGKTTLLRAALGLQPLDGGEAQLSGRRLADLSEAERAALAGYLPQERKVAWNLSALSVVSLGVPGEPPRLACEIAGEMLERVGLTRLADRGVLDMSGGERARVLLARLLATRAPLLMADEPAAGLDPDAQLLILDILREEARRGAAVVLTLHDLTLAARFCDRVTALKDGRVVAEGRPEQALSPEALRQVFGLDGALVETSHGLVAAMRRGAQ